MPAVKFNEKSVAKMHLPDGKRQVIYWDEKTPGFGLLVGATTRTFIYQRDLAGVGTRRVTLGRYPDVTLTAARQDAIRKAADMLDGVDPNAERRQYAQDQQLQKWQRLTLQDAIDHHVLNMEASKCSRRSIDGLTHELGLYLGDGKLSPKNWPHKPANWLDKPLVKIDAEDCVNHHRKITRDNGPYVANRLIRQFKACYNDIRKVHPKLPPCPADAVRFNDEDRRREPIKDLKTWWTTVEGFTNPVRRDLNIFCVLTGMRSLCARQVKWDYIDWKEGTIKLPGEIVKGGEGFVAPLSGYVLSMLAKRQLDNRTRFSQHPKGDAGYVFPTVNTYGKVTFVQESKQQKLAKGEDGKYHKVSVVPTLHRCRDTFLSIGETRAAVDYVTLAALANHTLSKNNVTFGYVKPDLEHMRDCTERITAEILKLANVNAVEVANIKKSA